jgi:ferredoxin-NADP reductase
MAIVRKYRSEVVSIITSIENVYTVEFRSLEKPFTYTPGQFLHLALDSYDPAGQWPDSRCFSMQSSPNSELIKITYAVKGNFTDRMRLELKIGREVTLKLPYGDLFTQPHNKENTVFIAGGTGITPFLSLFNHSTFSEYITPVLYAGFRNKGMNLYRAELEMAQKINPFFKVTVVYQEIDGILNVEKIYEASDHKASFFISGPPVMIKTFKKVLITIGVPSNQVLTDDWE